ncbi:MAG: altronate dehydratase [Synergistaceae bacterium]|nr:altronate dehydratase [Synergistaceae bacterium]
MNKVIKINDNDMVAVSLQPNKAGETVHVSALRGCVTVTEDIKMGHKIALRDIKAGEPVIKYGFPIGEAKSDIAKGGHVHTENLRTLLSSAKEYSWQPVHPVMKQHEPSYFNGYKRKVGRAGIRNELWIIPTVGCVNDICESLAERAKSLLGDGIDNVRAFTHPYGCSQLSEDQENTRKILADLVTHPNAGGVLLLGLGCENSGIDTIKKYLDEYGYDAERARFLIAQEVDDELEAGFELLKELALRMRSDKREQCSAAELVVGLKCGGSDGLSGITANPTIGGFSDLLISCGGSTILTEVPEMFGAETLLMGRCETEENYEKTVKLINDFKAYFESYGQPVYENPSPGNRAGGITTLEDKALGCTQKSGSAPVMDVLKYADRVKAHGLSLLSAPGNDLVASTALAAAGAQLVLFSTGRGTPFGCPAPTVKISSNSELAAKKSNWIDFDAGTLVHGGTLHDRALDLFNFVLEVASGKKTRNEINNFQGMAIFKNGATL